MFTILPELAAKLCMYLFHNLRKTRICRPQKYMFDLFMGTTTSFLALYDIRIF